VMDLLVDLGVLVLLLTLLVGGLAVWRIGHVVSWRALATTAWATRSFTACVAFIRFCAETRDLVTENQPHGQRPGRSPVGPGHVLEEWPRAS
jgi:hypothetical protein